MCFGQRQGTDQGDFAGMLIEYTLLGLFGDYIRKRKWINDMEKLRISENRRYFVKEDNTPFTWLADTDWTMPQRLKWDDVEYFMRKRKNQGFTVLQIVALDPERDPGMRNPAGEKALLNDDLLNPNERYFEYLDWVLDKAEEYGFYVLLLPIWGELVVGHNWGGEFSEKKMTVENAYQYGEFIGNRCKHRKNILWCLGGDRQPIHLGESYKDVWRLLAEGIAKGVLGKELKYDRPDPAWESLMMTYHSCYEMETGECSTMSYWDDQEAWISFIMLQSGHGKHPRSFDMVKKEYDRPKTLPVWDGEPAYEKMPTSWPEITDFHGSWMVRKRAYWSLLAGAFGYTYGHSSVWCAVSEKERNHMCPMSWYEGLQDEGAEQMRYLRAFMDSTKIMEWTPAQELLSIVEEDELDTHLQAAVSPNKDILCIYLSGGGKAKIDISALEILKAGVWWFNPRDGKFYDENMKEAVNAREIACEERIITICAPTEGKEQDWIVFIQREPAGKPVRLQNYYELEESAKAKKVFEW